MTSGAKRANPSVKYRAQTQFRDLKIIMKNSEILTIVVLIITYNIVIIQAYIFECNYNTETLRFVYKSS